jgi:hypothetical protein
MRPLVLVPPPSRATPKSMILAGRPRGRNRLDGFTSRWTMPFSWAWPRPAEQLEHDRQRRPRIRAHAALDRALQVHAFQQLHGDERRAVVLAQLVDGDDVRVLQARDGARLAQEALLVLRPRRLHAHDLERDVAVEGLVASAEDDPHRALADALEDAEAADRGRDVHGRRDDTPRRRGGGLTGRADGA